MMLTVLKAILVREVKLGWRDKSAIVQVFFFYAVVLTFFQLYLPSESRGNGAAVLSAVLAVFAQAGSLLEGDYQRNYLQQLYLTGVAMEGVVGAKLLSLSITRAVISFCYLFVYRVLAFGDFVVDGGFVVTWIAIALSTILIGTMQLFIEAIALGRQVKTTLIAMPLAMPYLVLSAVALEQPVYLLLIAALLLVFIPIIVVSAAAAVRMSLGD